MSKFTVEEINFMCVFETQDRTDMIGQIRQVMPHIKDSDMEELGEQVLGKLQSITDEEFAEISLEAAEDMRKDRQLAVLLAACFFIFSKNMAYKID